MPSKTRLTFLLLLICFYSYGGEHLVERVSSTSQVSLLSLIRNKNAVVMFYKPECAACRRQVGELACLEKSVSRVALGFGGEKRVLWRESKKLNLKSAFGDNIFLSNRKVKNLFGLKNDYSPQIFVFKKGKISKHFLGVTPCSDLTKAM
jgi:thiol-disulfide isomerase/thioredoxin